MQDIVFKIKTRVIDRGLRKVYNFRVKKFGRDYMKVLVLNGSPKKNNSNTLKLTSAFLEGLASAGQTESEIINVADCNVKNCLGCFSCWNKTPGKCVIRDDMSDILDKIIAADVVIWSFPLYFFGMPSKIKAVMDRQLPMFLPFMEGDTESGGHRSRYDLSGKRQVVISTCGFYKAEGNYAGVTAQFDRLCGENGYTTVFCGQGELFRVPELKKRTDEYLSYVRQAGAEFYSGKVSDFTRSKLSELLFPRDTFEKMADASWGEEKVGDEIVKADPSLTFTKQMAALYNKGAWKGKDVVLEMDYTDVGKSYQIVLKKDGHEVLTDNFLAPTTTIETPITVWQDIASGKIGGEDAMMQKQYRVKGDFDLMLQWDDFFGFGSETDSAYDGTKGNGGANGLGEVLGDFGGGNGKAAKPVRQKKSNMWLMLSAWMTIWIFLSIDSFWGAIAGIAVSAAIPLLFIFFAPTVFEYISIFAVTALGVLSIIFGRTDIILPVSYALFGVMWTVTSFIKLPLTAHYSKNGYGGDKALKNPLFIKTNRILTLAWGILYLITPVWTYFIMKSNFSYLSGAINSVLPMIMGVFTAWFQRWYPKHYASK